MAIPEAEESVTDAVGKRLPVNRLKVSHAVRIGRFVDDASPVSFFGDVVGVSEFRKVSIDRQPGFVGTVAQVRSGQSSAGRRG